MDIKILPATPEDGPEVGRFLSEVFYPEEPLNSSLGRNPDPSTNVSLDLLKEGLSFKAVDSSGNILVGLMINKKVSFAKKRSVTEEKDPFKQKINKLLNELDERSNLWQIVNNEDHFNLLSLSVSRKYRGQKISQKLLEESLKLAKSLGYNFASIECSSIYSAQVAIDMGFELLGEIQYEEFRDENGEQIFKVKPPHKAIKKLIKRL